MEPDTTELRNWLDQMESANEYEYSETEVLNGVVVWCNWAMEYDEPSLPVNVLFTDERREMDAEEITESIGETLQDTEFAPTRYEWEKNPVANNPKSNYDIWVNNPNYQ